MCARRFLGCVFILILLAVAGAFAVFQFGDRALISVATPKGQFEAVEAGGAPDYAEASAWVARPDLPDDPSRWVPGGLVSTKVGDPAATFYIHPTTYLATDRWNGPIDSNGDVANRTNLFVRSQASAFNAISEVWAPRYRQAAFGAFLLTNENATKALDLAYGDVLRALDTFLAAQSPTKPLILAAHSQGSLHLLRLLKDRRGALKDRLVAAYVAGWPVGVTSDLPATGLLPCAAADQSGCVLSWQSFSDPPNTEMVTDAWLGTKGLTGANHDIADMLCVNPLTGTRDAAAPPAANLGTLAPDQGFGTANLLSGRVGAACKGGFLIIDGDVPDLGPYVLPGNNYHVYDYALFWGSVRADAERRLKAFRQ
jgi:hypothetical protein